MFRKQFETFLPSANFRAIYALVLLFSLLNLASFAQSERSKVEREYFPGEKAKNFAVYAAKYSHLAYLLTKQIAFGDNLSIAKEKADSALYFHDLVLVATDSALANSTDTAGKDSIILARTYSRVTIQYTLIAEIYLNKVLHADFPEEIRDFGMQAMFAAGNGTVDSYNASIYYADSKLKEEEEVAEEEEEEPEKEEPVATEDPISTEDTLVAEVPKVKDTIPKVAEVKDTIPEVAEVQDTIPEIVEIPDTVVSEPPVVVKDTVVAEVPDTNEKPAVELVVKEEPETKKAEPVEAAELGPVKRLELDESIFTGLVNLYEKRLSEVDSASISVAEGLKKKPNNKKLIAQRDSLNQEDVLLQRRLKAADQKLKITTSRIYDRITAEDKVPPTVKEGEFTIGEPGSYKDEAIPIDETLPEGIVYRVRLGYSKRGAKPEWTDRITPVGGEEISGGVIRYNVGIFYSYAEANEAQKQLAEIGLKETAVIAYVNGKKVSTSTAIRKEITQINSNR